MVVALVDRVELMARLERAQLVGAELSQDPEQGPYRQPTRQSSVIVVQRRGLEGIVRGIPMQANISGGSLDDVSACLNFPQIAVGACAAHLFVFYFADAQWADEVVCTLGKDRSCC